MSFAAALSAGNIMLTEGSIIELLRRNPGTTLDPRILHAGFLFEKRPRAILEQSYRDYIDIGAAFNPGPTRIDAGKNYRT